MIKQCLTSARCHLISLIMGLILIILGVVLYFIINYLVYKEVLKNVVLAENSTSIARSMWQQPNIPIYLQFYVFHLENPAEVLNGAKPALKQKGPYTYRELVKKEDVTYHSNGTVSYRQVKSWHFVRSKSVGNDSDNFTTANIPLLTLVESLRWENPVFQKRVAFLLELLNEKLFITKTVNEIVWGYQDEMLAIGKMLMPDWIYSDFLGIYSGKNNTHDGLYTIYTGEDDYTKLATIDKYNGASSLKFWTSAQANMINGSDGTVGRPFIDKSIVVYAFISDICRSIYATFHEKTAVEYGVEVWRFTAPIVEYRSGRTDPDNAGFCTPAGNCLGDGLLNMTQCRMFDHFHVPIIASLPNFYLADPKYLQAVIGLTPVPDQHRVDIFLEPTTGLPMRLYKRLQVNVYIQSNKFVREMGNVNNIIYPILWLNESLVVDDVHLKKLYYMLFLPQTIASVAQCVILVLGACLLVLTSSLYMYKKCKQRQAVVYASLSTDTVQATT